jgi:hypothetical protein
MIHLNQCETVVQDFGATKLAGGPRASGTEAMADVVSKVFLQNLGRQKLRY